MMEEEERRIAARREQRLARQSTDSARRRSMAATGATAVASHTSGPSGQVRCPQHPTHRTPPPHTTHSPVPL